MITLDNTKTKSNLGANALLGVSLAVTKATANFLVMDIKNQGRIYSPLIFYLTTSTHLPSL